MKASEMQTLLKLNSNVLTGLHEEHSKLLAERKRWNALGDTLAASSSEAAFNNEHEKAVSLHADAEAHFGQAAIYSPYIKKFAKKIATLSTVQKSLKADLKERQIVDAWLALEESFNVLEGDTGMAALWGYIGENGEVEWE